MREKEAKSESSATLVLSPCAQAILCLYNSVKVTTHNPTDRINVHRSLPAPVSDSSRLDTIWFVMVDGRS